MLTLYTLTSSLHSEAACNPAEEKFIREIEEVLGEDFDFRGEDFSGYGETLNNLIYVRTGGTEGIFKSEFFRDGQLQVPDHKPVRLLTSGKSNSLAASMDILEKSYMEAQRKSSGNLRPAIRWEARTMYANMTWDGYWRE